MGHPSRRQGDFPAFYQLDAPSDKVPPGLTASISQR
jgi:hypothetical protein